MKTNVHINRVQYKIPQNTDKRFQNTHLSIKVLEISKQGPGKSLKSCQTFALNKFKNPISNFVSYCTVCHKPV